MPSDEGRIEARAPAHAPDLVLEQVAQRLHELAGSCARESADVVVRLDRRRRAAHRRGLDAIGVDRPLRQERDVAQRLALLFEDRDERLADDLALALRVLDAASG
jgi:hypothetical protein